MKILLVDDEEDMNTIFSSVANDEGIEVTVVDTAEKGIEIVCANEIGAVFLDLKLPGMNGMDALREIKSKNSEIPVVIITGYETVETAVEAIKLGAYDYLVKPIPLEKLKVTIRNAARTYQLSRKVRSLQEKVAGRVTLENIVGSSARMHDLFSSIRRIAGFDVTVLLLGETGTGKEMAARAIHSESGREHNPFVPIDCATLPEHLFESQLFGHEKGAFTGAGQEHIGRFEQADRGTIFLDEIGNIPIQLQAKLLRVVETGEIARVGGKEVKRIDVRIICATNVDLEEAVSEGKFREDLYHRINVFPIRLPPLRERDGDIEILSTFFLEKYNREFSKNVRWLTKDAISILNGYDWPGNVRELENVTKRAVIMASSEISPTHLPIAVPAPAPETVAPLSPGGRGKGEEDETENIEMEDMPLREFRECYEKPFIHKILIRHNWNKKKVAETLGIDYKTLLSRIKEYNLQL